MMRWPSREQWAKRRRTFYDDDHVVRVSEALADYATESDQRAAIAELGDLWRDLGRQLRAATDRQRKSDFRIWRALTRRVINTLKRGEFPRYVPPIAEQSAAFMKIVERHAKRVAAEKDLQRRKIEALPIDDAAWNRELGRRKRIEQHEASGR
jgi:hypothetical protein